MGFHLTAMGCITLIFGLLANSISASWILGCSCSDASLFLLSLCADSSDGSWTMTCWVTWALGRMGWVEFFGFVSPWKKALSSKALYAGIDAMRLQNYYLTTKSQNITTQLSAAKHALRIGIWLSPGNYLKRIQLWCSGLANSYRQPIGRDFVWFEVLLRSELLFQWRHDGFTFITFRLVGINLLFFACSRHSSWASLASSLSFFVCFNFSCRPVVPLRLCRCLFISSFS